MQTVYDIARLALLAVLFFASVPRRPGPTGSRLGA